MDENRKRAYRYILYWATVDLRNRSPAWAGSWPRFWSPPFWIAAWRQFIYATEVVNWLHNLAFFSAYEFDGFDENRFWRDYEAVREKLRNKRFLDYRSAFDRMLAGDDGWPSPHAE